MSDKAPLLTLSLHGAKALQKLVKADLFHYYGLAEPVTMTFSSEGSARPCGVGNADYDFIHIRSEKGGDRVELRFDPFKPDTEAYNGPNALPDYAAPKQSALRDGRMEAALLHDVLWMYAAELGEQLGMSELEVMQWANDLFPAAWRGYARRLYPEKAAKAGFFARMAYPVVRTVAPWWKRLKKLFGITCLALSLGALSLGCQGCASDPGWVLEEATPVQWYSPSGLATNAEPCAAVYRREAE